MNARVHYLLTILSLLFLGLIATKPDVLRREKFAMRVCKEHKGKIDCKNQSLENRIQMTFNKQINWPI